MHRLDLPSVPRCVSGANPACEALPGSQLDLLAAQSGRLLDAEWGPWMGLRAAAFVPFSLPVSSPAPDLCADCAAPCEVACPGDAFVEGRWSVARCASFHQVSVACVASCAARSACPVGSVHRYSDLELLYHYNRAQRRVALRAALGIPAEQDPHLGSGPFWGAWSGAAVS